ncbi:hypothetical protein GCM10008967_03250 [Bacillus carboniphilus]|uniref:Uncharacterized protein n=1 Tax=Bacillus carboniphilus TaxID=86663 RepID=A0ABN0VSW2_9BACI
MSPAYYSFKEIKLDPADSEGTTCRSPTKKRHSPYDRKHFFTWNRCRFNVFHKQGHAVSMQHIYTI